MSFSDDSQTSPENQLLPEVIDSIESLGPTGFPFFTVPYEVPAWDNADLGFSLYDFPDMVAIWDDIHPGLSVFGFPFAAPIWDEFDTELYQLNPQAYNFIPGTPYWPPFDQMQYQTPPPIKVHQAAPPPPIYFGGHPPLMGGIVPPAGPQFYGHPFGYPPPPLAAEPSRMVPTPTGGFVYHGKTRAEVIDDNKTEQARGTVDRHIAAEKWAPRGKPEDLFEVWDTEGSRDFFPLAAINSWGEKAGKWYHNHDYSDVHFERRD